MARKCSRVRKNYMRTMVTYSWTWLGLTDCLLSADFIHEFHNRLSTANPRNETVESHAGIVKFGINLKTVVYTEKRRIREDLSGVGQRCRRIWERSNWIPTLHAIFARPDVPLLSHKSMRAIISVNINRPNVKLEVSFATATMRWVNHLCFFHIY